MDRGNCKTLVCELRSLGLFMNQEMNKIIGKNHRQFLVACVVSKKEINEGTFHRLLNNARFQLNNLLNGFVNASKRYFRLKRLLFLMNFKDSSQKDQHTEARLLDPTGNILKQLKNSEHGENHEDYNIFDDGFLASLKRDFMSEFGSDESFIIVMFSYFLPCTQPKHMCAELIRKFADRTKTNIIVSYDMPYMTTDEHAAIDAMNCDTVSLIHPEECYYFRFEGDLQFINQRSWMRPPYMNNRNNIPAYRGAHGMMEHYRLPIFPSLLSRPEGRVPFSVNYRQPVNDVTRYRGRFLYNERQLLQQIQFYTTYV